MQHKVVKEHIENCKNEHQKAPTANNPLSRVDGTQQRRDHMDLTIRMDQGG